MKQHKENDGSKRWAFFLQGKSVINRRRLKRKAEKRIRQQTKKEIKDENIIE